MVCPQQEGYLKVTIEDWPPLSEPLQVHVTPSKIIEDIFKEISEKCGYPLEDLEIVFKVFMAEINLGKHKEKGFFDTLLEEGISSIQTDCELIVRKDKTLPLSLSYVPPAEDDLLLGASASPTTSEVVSSEEFTYIKGYRETRRRDAQGTIHGHTEPEGPRTYDLPNYVGLVNQAMTCYLNSLLQALYMTPEFRNALYNWEFDGVNETRSIPYQLQKLFLNLQTSNKSAVETTDLTTSFGWQGSDAWHQHDIQELCRVMFDALEQKFKDTKQANLINDLYEGKMLDYVKCLECHTEKSREDTFLDIPLPVRAFGSTVAYNSVEEALRAFVQPETLDENNQYFCEKCNKKCDAHKGLKFTKFPYLLTLHLKRFDFDYNTMHRIKLNDKVVFPEKLNLNSFVTTTKAETEQAEERETTVKCDDCSTTDSGSADDESCQGTDMSLTVNGPDDNCADSDEGIDVSSGINHDNDAKGPFVYELFSIMIHSGSASGGHYYAYIKDFDKNLWYCFNDQSVSPITEEDIRKTYGGGPQRGYYSSVYTSSTNAYMLMYRQIDKERNISAMSVDEFPPHIQQSLQNMRLKEEEDRLLRKKEDDMVKLNFTCIHPTTASVMDVNISTFKDATLSEIAQHTRSRFKLDNLVDLNDCRVVSYNKKFNCVHCSFEDENAKLCEVINSVDMYYIDWFLEIKEPGTQWRQYRKGGINVTVYPIDVDTKDINEPKLTRLDVGETVAELKNDLSDLLDVDPTNLMVIFENAANDQLQCLKDDEEIIKFENIGFNFIQDYKFFVANVVDKDQESSKKNWVHFANLVGMFQNVACVNLVLPDTDEATLELLAIPSLDLNQNLDRSHHESSPERAETNSPNLRVSPQLGGMSGDGYDQSNSEDSSLSDSDRTLIGDAPECVAVYSNSSASPGDQHMASPVNPCQEGTYNYDVMGHMGEEMSWDYTDPCSRTGQMCNNVQNTYLFKITSIIPHNELIRDIKGTRCCKVLVDKRMYLETFKKNLEQILRVPSEYFKIYKHERVIKDYVEFNDNLKSLKGGEMLSVKLEKILRENEHRCKVYHLQADMMNPNCFLFEHIITKDTTVSAVKKQILKQVKKTHGLDVPYNMCRLREKSYKNKPAKVYLDDQRFGSEIDLTLPFEFYLQHLKEPESVTSDNQIVVFVRRWHPSDLTLEVFQEVILDVVTMAELKGKISALSLIPKERVEVASIKHNYPCDMHLLEIYEELDWNPTVWNLNQWPRDVEDGSVFYYKDSEEIPKVLTPEEKKEIKQKEDARLCRPSAKTYSPSRERALKIYLDTSSPSKTEDSLD